MDWEFIEGTVIWTGKGRLVNMKIKIYKCKERFLPTF